ncbi:SpoIIE family protein phosphatase [Streptomyces sp. NPDC049590]|uniref:SpoIIE family protein phosphatase n=1 Tax=Streptomyces sp. NPDC049590 TaxID=3154834 RepID=UPI00342E574E
MTAYTPPRRPPPPAGGSDFVPLSKKIAEDDALPAIITVPTATLVLALLEGSPHTGPWTLRWTSAGHPPPLLPAQDGQAQYLEARQGLLLGAGSSTVGSRPNATQSLPPVPPCCSTPTA